MKNYVLLMVSLCVFLAISTSEAVVFTTPIPVGVDTERTVRGLSMSADELNAYFYFNDEYPNSFDIFSATRPDKNSPFGVPLLVTGVSTAADECHPCLSLDELTMYYTFGGSSNRDLYMATRESTSNPFSNQTALTILNSSDNDSGASITADGLTIVYHSNRSGELGGYGLLMATRADINSPFGTPVNIAELNSSDWDIYPSISSDGKVIYFSTLRESSSSEIWMATRPDISSAFSAPYRIDEVNVEGVSTGVFCISRDGQTLYFGSPDREGSLPGGLWMSRVVPEPSMLTIMAITGVMAFFRGRRKR